MTDKIVVLNTCEKEAEAESLARLLIDRQLAACVNIVPQVRSFYRWKGSVESSEEFLLMVKTSRALFDEVKTAIEQAHSYEIPEIVALPVVDGAADYLGWLESNLKKAPEPE